jgi:two-component system CheB/CheR fusion protein
VTEPPLGLGAEPVDEEFEELLEHLLATRAVDFTGYKRPSLVRLVGRRMQAAGIDDYRAYRDHLEVDPAEFARLFDTLLINVTSFFRDPQAWAVVRTRALPRLLEDADPDVPLRVWSAACATGEEPYSWAVLLAEALGPEAFARRVKIYATDIDENALATARAGRYPAAALADVDPALVERWFTPDGGSLVVHPDLRSAVIFGRHDLIQDAPISRVSLLSCRNVLMYFNHETQTRVLDRLSFALADEGLLLLGRAEMLLTQADVFTPVDMSNRLFVKSRRAVRGLRGAFGPRGRDGEAGLARVAQSAFDRAPEPQLVLDAGGSLSLANDSALSRLRLERADVGRPWAELTLGFAPDQLRQAVASVQTSRAPLDVPGLVDLTDGRSTIYDVRLVPLADEDGEPLGVQVSFADVTRYSRLNDELQAARRELETAYEELQTSNEELETTNEELQSAVEELETTNEELQSTNEELETMNEELQSTNEELQTLNDELRDRTGEVNEVNSFLESVLTSLRGGVVVVDRDLVVRVWNERAEQLWGLRSFEAQGRALMDLDVGLPVGRLRLLLGDVLGGRAEHRDALVPAHDRFGREIACAISCSAMHDPVGQVSGALVLMEERAPGEAS